MHVHLIGIAGTGMGAFAGLLRASGHRVTGSDTAFYPPMGDALAAWGIETREGFRPEHLTPKPDLVIIGNVCRPQNPEARAAIDGGLPYASFPRALADLFLRERKSLVIGGTHGKTTTSAMLAFLLDRTLSDNGFLVGGVPLDFPESFRAGRPGGFFVVEGDEYDSAFYEKFPKFWQYRPAAAVLTSIEHDHIDIYPTEESYLDAFRGFIERLPSDGTLVAAGDDRHLPALVRGAPCNTIGYALDGDVTHGLAPTWVARPRPPRDGLRPFEIIVRGETRALAHCPMPGLHNVRNALAAIALAHEAAGVPIQALVDALPAFRGIKRRQELRGIAGDVRVYDDFAHHPTAVRETLLALKEMNPQGRLAAVFEPRSATASRRLHQGDYAGAFSAAELTLLAPVGRADIPAEEKLDVAAIARAIQTDGRDADAPPSLDAIVERLVSWAKPGDTIAVLSNGAFGGIHARLLRSLA